jgi:signal transduction histidine kinase
VLGASFLRGASRRLIAAFVLLLPLPAAAVVWLGIRLVIQDRQLEAEGLRAERENAAERIVLELSKRLSDAERALVSAESPGDDAVRLAMTRDGIEAHPTTRLLYYPGLRLTGDGGGAFSAGEELEYRHNDLDAAAAAFRRLTADRPDDVRAGALVRLARVLRKKGARKPALQLYDDLARLNRVRIDGVPADLVARRARCHVLAELDERGRLISEATALRADLLTGAWRIDRGTFVQYEGELAAWLGSAAPVPSSSLALAEAASWLWEQRGTNGRRAARFAGVDLTLLWQSSGEETIALVTGPAFQQQQWFSVVNAVPVDGGLNIGLASPDGTISGVVRQSPESSTLRLASSQTGLPWDLIVSTGDSSSIGASRRLAILVGLGFLVLLVLAGGYVITRAVTRELAVARLQSDFVASVSHEFRTPLTSLRQFTDLLSEGDDLALEKRKRFYAAQSRATDRLQRLVESLLDFRRMEAGTHPYQRRRLAASGFVESVVEDFRPEASARGFEVEYTTSANAQAIDADPEAMSLALWNLLDNAVKYSGDSRRVSVVLARNNGSIAISVRDGGLGVPHDEQREIFRQFVRGHEARARGIKGTGIGLAMVQHIVQGHGGRVELESVPGEGSTFTIVLPAHPERAPASRGAAG